MRSASEPTGAAGKARKLMSGNRPGAQPPSRQPILIECPVIRFDITSGARGRPSFSAVADSSSPGIGSRSLVLSFFLPHTVMPADTASSSQRGSRGETSNRSARLGSAFEPSLSLSTGSDGVGGLPLAVAARSCSTGACADVDWARAVATGTIDKTAIQRTCVTLDKTVFLSLGLVHTSALPFSTPTSTQELQ